MTDKEILALGVIAHKLERLQPITAELDALGCRSIEDLVIRLANERLITNFLANSD